MCDCKTPAETGTLHGFRCGYHKQEILQLRAAARAVVSEWGAYVGQGDTEGHDDAVLVGESVALLIAALDLDSALRRK